jgi:hypothetical protein
MKKRQDAWNDYGQKHGVTELGCLREIDSHGITNRNIENRSMSSLACSVYDRKKNTNEYKPPLSKRKFRHNSGGKRWGNPSKKNVEGMTIFRNSQQDKLISPEGYNLKDLYPKGQLADYIYKKSKKLNLNEPILQENLSDFKAEADKYEFLEFDVNPQYDIAVPRDAKRLIIGEGYTFFTDNHYNSFYAVNKNNHRNRKFESQNGTIGSDDLPAFDMLDPIDKLSGISSSLSVSRDKRSRSRSRETEKLRKRMSDNCMRRTSSIEFKRKHQNN